MASTAAGNFVVDLKRITRNKRRAAEILTSTESYYAELTKQIASAVSGLRSKADEPIPVHTELSSADVDVLLRRFVAPVVLVVGGSRCSSVALLLRRLLGRAIFPDNGDAQSCPDMAAGKPCQIRDVRIQYGPSNRVTFSNGQGIRLSGSSSTPLAQPLVDCSVFHSSTSANSSVTWTSWFSSDLSLEVELAGVQLLRSVSILVTKQSSLSGVIDFASKLLSSAQPIVLFAGSELSSSCVPPQLFENFEIPLAVVSTFLAPSTLPARASEIESAISSSASSIRLSISAKNRSPKKRAKMNSKPPDVGSSGVVVFSISELDKATTHLMTVLQKGVSESVGVLAAEQERVLSELIDWSYSMTRDAQLTASRLIFVKDKCLEMYKLLRRVGIDQVPLIVEKSLAKICRNVQQRIGLKTENDNAISCETVLRELAIDIESRLAFECAEVSTTFIETLFRCVAALEDIAGSQGAIDALDEMTRISQNLNVPVEVGSSGLKKFFVRIRRLLSLSQDSLLDDMDLQLILDSLSTISEWKLSGYITNEILGRLEKAYETFVQTINQLITAHDTRLNKLEAFRCRIRRNFAPRVASLYLESISLRDLISYGRPAVGRELGRGQYGVVYSCEKWGPYKRLAVKSVVPADERHWGELALELYHARHLPEHPNMLTLRGSLIGYSNIDDSDNRLTAVLVVTDRMTSDLHVAMQRGALSWAVRLTITIDVCEALRFLHNRGLVHRDVKLKNVLLDSRNRARLADLGFCQPAALIAGSVVGTPIHMAPELLNSHFQTQNRTQPNSGLSSTRQFGSLATHESPDLLAAIDIYAFGILLWYICSGQTRLPKAFRDCDNRDLLWQAVRRGVRPERLPQFSNTAWELMEACWAADPVKRPHIGDVHMVLSDMLSDLAVQPGQLEQSISESSINIGDLNINASKS